MHKAGLCALILVLVVSGCGLLGPAPTPTMVPSQLADSAMQQAALAAVQTYATQTDYEYRNPSFSLVSQDNDKAVVHATVDFQTRQGFGYEQYDTLINLTNLGGTWTADAVPQFSKLEWEGDLQRGPVTLKSPAGFSVTVPAGWSGYVAAQSELVAPNICGTGMQPVDATPIFVAMPTGYSAANVPVVVRGFQQCPAAPGLSSILQRLQDTRDSNPTLRFDRLELTNLAGQTALAAVVTDGSGAVLYDYYFYQHSRQFELLVQAYPGQVVSTALGVLNSIRFQ
jgi:hypothetical protein